MGVAHCMFQRDVCRVDNGTAVVERRVVVPVGAEGKAYLLLPLCVAVEVGKEVVLHLLLPGDVYVPCLRPARRALAHLCRELHMLLAAGRLFQQLALMAQVFGHARCPRDGASLMPCSRQVEVGHQVVEMSFNVYGIDIGLHTGAVVLRGRHGHRECLLLADAPLAECGRKYHRGIAVTVCRTVYHSRAAYHALIRRAPCHGDAVAVGGGQADVVVQHSLLQRHALHECIDLCHVQLAVQRGRVLRQLRYGSIADRTVIYAEVIVLGILQVDVAHIAGTSQEVVGCGTQLAGVDGYRVCSHLYTVEKQLANVTRLAVGERVPCTGREPVVGNHVLLGLIVGQADGIACLVGPEEDAAIGIPGNVGRVGKGVDEVTVGT